MKSELRLKPHTVQPGVNVIELWHDGKFLATIAPADGPGVRIVSKHGIQASPAPEDRSGANVLGDGCQAGIECRSPQPTKENGA